MRTLTQDNTIEPAAYRASRVKMAAVASIVSRCGVLLVTIVSTPLAIDSLGKEQFGIWVTITTFFSLFSFLDGGVGNAVVNFVTDHRAGNAKHSIAEIIRSSYLVVCVAGLVAMIVTWLGAYTIDWRWAISLPDEVATADARNAFIVAGLMFASNIPLGLAAKIRRGLQASHLNSAFDMIGHAITLAATIFAWAYGASLLWFLLAFAVGPTIANSINTWLLSQSPNRDLRPGIAGCTLTGSRQILNAGSLFLGLQLCAALAFQTDAIIVSHLCGLGAAADLGTVNRMFLIATSLTAFVTTPLWPAFRDAAARGESSWIRSVFRRTFWITTAVSLAITTPLLIGHRMVLVMWTGNAIDPPASLVLAIFLWTNLLVFGNLINSFMHGMNILKQQLLLSVLMTMLNVPLSIYLTKQFDVSGVIYGSIFSYLLCFVIPFLWMLPRYLRQLPAGLAAQPEVAVAT